MTITRQYAHVCALFAMDVIDLTTDERLPSTPIDLTHNDEDEPMHLRTPAEQEHARAAAPEDEDRTELDALREALTCSICATRPYNRIITPCGHGICISCLSSLHMHDCPFCRRPMYGSVPFYSPLSNS